MTETEVRKSGRRALVGRVAMEDVSRAFEKGETEGFMKVLVDAESRQILGATVLGTAGAHSVAVPIDALRTADPEVVLVAPCGFDLPRATAEARRLLDHPAWQWLAGRAVWALDANALLSRPGPRLVEGVEAIAKIMHAGLLGEPGAAAAERIL